MTIKIKHKYLFLKKYLSILFNSLIDIVLSNPMRHMFFDNICSLNANIPCPKVEPSTPGVTVYGTCNSNTTEVGE
jgi:hypothetical protein